MGKLVERTESLYPKKEGGGYDFNAEPKPMLTRAWYCPGCGYTHSFWDDGRWTFDGNFDAPTFSPSLMLDPIENGWPKRCHTFVKAGRIQFLDDCSHELKGQTVDMVDVEDWPEFARAHWFDRG